MVIVSAHTCNRYFLETASPPECEPPLSPGKSSLAGTGGFRLGQGAGNPTCWRSRRIHTGADDLWVGSHRSTVGFLLSANKGVELLIDPVTLQPGKHLVIIQLFQVIGKLLVLYSQEVKK